MTPARVPWGALADVLESTIGFDGERVRAAWTGPDEIYRHTPPDRLPPALAERLVGELLNQAGCILPQHAQTAPEPRPNGPLDIGGSQSGWAGSWPEKAETQTTDNVLALVVREMRAAQVEYFRTRDQGALRRSTALERRVDLLLDPKAQPEQPQQTSLFLR